MGIDLEAIRRRLEARSVADGDCIVWIGSKMGKHQYGGLKVGRTTLYVHRLAYQIHHGEIPAGLVVMHKCDRPQCLNPEHLMLGTQAENVADMHSKGRNTQLAGSRNGRSILTDEDVAAIRARYVRYCRKDGAGAIAKDYGVTKSAILYAISGHSWSSVP